MKRLGDSMGYIWQHSYWPNFTFQSDQLLDSISMARLNQGKGRNVSYDLWWIDYR